MYIRKYMIKYDLWWLFYNACNYKLRSRLLVKSDCAECVFSVDLEWLGPPGSIGHDKKSISRFDKVQKLHNIYLEKKNFCVCDMGPPWSPGYLRPPIKKISGNESKPRRGKKSSARALDFLSESVAFYSIYNYI